LSKSPKQIDLSKVLPSSKAFNKKSITRSDILSNDDYGKSRPLYQKMRNYLKETSRRIEVQCMCDNFPT
jgi:hypothetical protein